MSGGSACVGIAAALSKSIVTGLGPVTHTVTVDVRDSTSPKTLTTGPNKICDTGIVTGIPAFTLHRPKLLAGASRPPLFLCRHAASIFASLGGRIFPRMPVSVCNA